MPILVDGHNLIGRLPVLSLQDPDDEAKLVSLLKSYRARTGKKVTVIFDSGEAFALPERRRQGGIEIVFAAHGVNADDLILRRVRRSRNPQDWLVITSDRRLADLATQQGARVQSAEDFAALLDPAQDSSLDWKDAHLSPNEVETWLTLFGSQD